MPGLDFIRARLVLQSYNICTGGGVQRSQRVERTKNLDRQIRQVVALKITAELWSEQDKHAAWTTTGEV